MNTPEYYSRKLTNVTAYTRLIVNDLLEDYTLALKQRDESDKAAKSAIAEKHRYAEREVSRATAGMYFGRGEGL